MATEHVDVLIVGAGISGIGAAYHLQKHCPNKRYAILEGRDAIGGTWDLFRYPGIRSDSDMYTLGYSFKPWLDPKIIADGHTIRGYVKETARENGIDRHIRFGHKVLAANWDSADARWTFDVEQKATGKKIKLSANFVIMGTGYYNYDAGYTPHFEGREDFKGAIVHPQLWPKNFDYSGKKVVIIGSGATAVTLLPAMTDKAKHVTMLQRSPTYVASIPERDVISEALRKVLPNMAVYRMGRTRNIGLQASVFNLAKKQPKVLRRILLGLVRRQLAGSGVDMKHFTPSYNPWEERLCAVPDGDLFRALRHGKASVVTDHIERFTANGIALKSGAHLDADIIITATGLSVQTLGGAQVSVDGKPVEVSKRLNYKGMMLEDVPNLVMVFGYTNASWTLKADLISEYACRLIKHMDKTGERQCMPVNNDASVEPMAFVDMRSGYLQRAVNQLPKQGSKSPWKAAMSYASDLVNIRFGKVDDGIMQFSRPSAARPVAIESARGKVAAGAR